MSVPAREPSIRKHVWALFAAVFLMLTVAETAMAPPAEAARGERGRAANPFTALKRAIERKFSGPKRRGPVRRASRSPRRAAPVALPPSMPVPASRAGGPASAVPGSAPDEKQEMSGSGTAPLPTPKEQPAAEAQKPSDHPPPAGKPEGGENDAEPSEAPQVLPEGNQAPLPSPKSPVEAKPEDAPPSAPLPPPLPPEQSAADIQCRARLKALGAVFEDRPSESDPSGCLLPHPVLLRKLSASIELTPGGLMNCATAKALSKFAQTVIAPSARKHFGADLVAIGQASAYVCRPRHGTKTLSEHAFGNAVDMSRFTLSKGTAVDVSLTPGEKDGAFLKEIRAAACGPFKTVLGPGSDADHATHLHLDLEQRRHGGTVCQ